MIDGTIRLLSKLCFYCLLLSILWLSEPYLYPSEADPITPAAGKKKQPADTDAAALL